MKPWIWRIVALLFLVSWLYMAACMIVEDFTDDDDGPDHPAVTMVWT
jgi:hypothetical protein